MEKDAVMNSLGSNSIVGQSVQVPVGDHLHLQGDLQLPEHCRGIVLFAHGSGSSRHSPRNQSVAATFREAGLGTLLFDLLTADEEFREQHTKHLRFDISLLAERLARAARWLTAEREVPYGFFGASTGGGAALVAAAQLGRGVRAVVSRGGRPDLADTALPLVTAPTLLIVGALDDVVIQLNRRALERMFCERHLEIVPGASHLFEEPGTLAAVASLATDWFLKYFSTG
jgi:putative phosphoribosyl transferase